MKRFLSLAIVAVALSAAAGTAGAVVILGPGVGPPILKPPFWGPPAPTPPRLVRAPEIDPASALAGLTLLAGGLSVLRGRRGRKSED